MRKLAKLFTRQSRQPITRHLCVSHLFSTQAQRAQIARCGWFPTGTSTPVVGLGGEAWSVKQVMGPPNSRGGGLDGPAWPCPGFQHLQRCWQGRAGARPWTNGSLLLEVFWRQATWGFRPQLWTIEPGSAGVIQHHGTQLRAEARWPKEVVVATLGRHSPGGLDLMVDSMGTWKPLVDFCHFFAFPNCGNY